MTSEIFYKDKWVPLSNMQFARLIDLVIEAVRDRVGYWFPDTIDGREADRFVNKREST